MTKTGKVYFLFLCTLIWSFGAWADVKVRAYADRNEMGQTDTLDLTVQVVSTESVDVDEPKAPDLGAFQVLNTFTSSSTSSTLGRGPRGMEFQTVRTTEFHYQISPQKQGNLPVPSFTVKVDGKNYQTAPFTIRVSGNGSGASQAPGRPNDDETDDAEAMFNALLQRRGEQNAPHEAVVPKNPNESFFVHLDLDKREVYEGEQITANWYLYSRGNILSLDRLKFPDLRGFWKEIIEEVPALNFTTEVLNGVTYRRALLASHALFPIKPGIAVIDEYKVKATVQLPNMMGAFGGQAYSYTRSSDRVEIKVKPLPSEGKPKDFSGAVGQFEVTSSVEQPEVPINQPFSMKLRFEGEGNAKLIELPPLALPNGLEVYDTKSDAKFFKNGRSFKEFEVMIIPREPGAVTLPSISVSLFDPKSGKYYSKKTDPISLKVTGVKADVPADPSLTNTGKPAAAAAAAVVKPDLPPVLTSYEGDSGVKFSGPIALSLMALVALALLGWKALRELGRKEKKATAQELLKNRMKIVRKSLKSGDWRESATQMTNVIYLVLGAISGEGGASKELRMLLEKAPPSLRRDLGDELAKTLDQFQFLSFAPEEAIGHRKNTAALTKDIDSAEKLLFKSIDHLGAE